MNVVKCDRCGKKIPFPEKCAGNIGACLFIGRIFGADCPRVFQGARTRDLCEECKESLYEWLGEEKEVEENETD